MSLDIIASIIRLVLQPNEKIVLILRPVRPPTTDHFGGYESMSLDCSFSHQQIPTSFFEFWIRQSWRSIWARPMLSSLCWKPKVNMWGHQPLAEVFQRVELKPRCTPKVRSWNLTSQPLLLLQLLPFSGLGTGNRWERPFCGHWWGLHGAPVVQAHDNVTIWRTLTWKTPSTDMVCIWIIYG